MTITAVATLGFGGIFSSHTIHADSLQSLKQQKSTIQSERDSIKSELSDAEADIADVLFDIEKLNEAIQRTEEALKENRSMMKQTEKDITKANDEVAALEDEIGVLETNIEKRMDILHNRALSFQESGGNLSYMEVIFGAKSFGEFISRLAIVNRITESDADIVEEQEADKATLVVKQDKVETRLQELEDMKLDLDEMDSIIVAQREANAERKQDLNKKENNLRKLAAKLKVEDSRLASLESNISQSIAAATPSNGGNLTSLGHSSSSKPSNSSKPSGIPSGSGNMSTILNAGMPYLGLPYRWGGKSPSTGFDCSGFVSWAYKQGGVSIPSSTRSLRYTGKAIPYSEAKPGDLVFFSNTVPGRADSHVGIYLGNGKFIGAQSSNGVEIASMTSGYWYNHFKGHVRRIH